MIYSSVVNIKQILGTLLFNKRFKRNILLYLLCLHIPDVDCFDADIDNILKAPSVKGSHQYTQWIRKLWTETTKVFNQEARRFFTTCRTFLSVCKHAIIFHFH